MTLRWTRVQCIAPMTLHRSRGLLDHGRQVVPPLRAILNTAVTEDELTVVNPCRIKGAGEEGATERPVLTLDQLYAVVDLMPDR
jgi:hypothetical protein